MFTTKTEQVREVIAEFSCTGFGACALADIVVVAAGLPMPPALEMNSKDYSGVVPHNAIRYDEQSHAAYIRDNAVRVDPVPTLTTMSTTSELCTEFGWGETDLAAARAAGLLKPSGWRDVVGEEGFPVGLEPLYAVAVIRAALDRVKALPVGTR